MLVTFDTNEKSQVKPHRSSTIVKDLQEVDPSTNFFNFSKKRSRNGCLTCKIRKKKCDEIRPVCGDCLRLKRECVYHDPEMPEEELQDLKNKMETFESMNKTRKRKSSKQVGKPNLSPAETEKLKEEIRKHNNNKSRAYIPSTPAFFVHKSTTSHRSTFSPGQSRHGDETWHQPLSPSPGPSHRMSPVNFPRSPIFQLLDTDAFEPLSMDQSNDLHSHKYPTDVISLDSPKSEKGMASPTPSFLNFLKEIGYPEPNKITLLEDDGEEVQEKADHAISPATISSLLRFSPHSQAALSPSPESALNTLPVALDETGYQLYSYYHDHLAKIICISPQESNQYVNVFLPMAHKDPGILYSIIAWAGFHLGGEWEHEGLKYLDMALSHINSKGKSMKDYRAAPPDSESLFIKLANLLVLCGAEICRGDVKNWSFYLSWGSKLINSAGGIRPFVTGSEDKHWLISNFAYHDILASSTSERGTYFPIADYEKIFDNYFGLHPLVGVSKQLYNLVGEVSTLALESARLLEIELEESGEIAENVDQQSKSHKLFTKIVSKGKELEKKIDEAKPNPKDFANLTREELEWQLTLFESFQLTAKLHLRQSILKINPSSLETQLLLYDLIKCLDIVLKTPVEGCLVFPIFIAGITCVTQQDRMMMNERFEAFIERYGCRNVDKSKIIMEMVWERNNTGDKVIDWYQIVKDLDWDLSFA